MNALPAIDRADPQGRASVDEVRRPGRHRRPVLRGAARRDHRADRPQRRRQDDGVQLHHRLLQADRRHDHADQPRRQAVPARAPARLPDPGQGEGGAHLPEHPPVFRHDAAREPAGRAAQQADAGVGLHGARPARLRRLPQGVRRIDRAGEALAGEGEPDRPRRRSGRRPALRRAAPAGDRARHVHRTRAALPRRAGGRPQPAGIGGAERAAQRHQGHRRAPRSC